MKDNWIEMLFNLFEQGLNKLKEIQLKQDEEENTLSDEHSIEVEQFTDSFTLSPLSTRVFSFDEKAKLTKKSWQFLLRMREAGVLDAEDLESVMNTLIMSESQTITLDETKWAIRKTLYTQLSQEELRFLDLILYHKEQAVSLH